MSLTYLFSLLADWLTAQFSAACDVSFFDDTFFENYMENINIIPSARAIVVLDISANRSQSSKGDIYHAISAAHPNLYWHSSAYHYTFSTMILDIDSNGMINHQVQNLNLLLF